jgi:hypothetical protein
VRGKSQQPALDDPPVAAIEHVDHPPAVQITDDCGKLMPTAMMRLIQG